MIDLARVRADTPACEQIIHFNNAGASLMPDPVFAAVTDHLQNERRLGGYEAEREAQPVLESFYTQFAELLGVAPTEIAYIENATRAWDMAFYAIPLSEGDRIITHESEYASNYLAYLQLARRRGVEIDIVPSDGSGQIDVDALPSLLTSQTRVIAIGHVPTQGGLVNPAEEVGAFARDHGLIYVLDACQSVGQLDVRVPAIGCHILSGTGRKFLRGPRGTGFLYVANALLDSLEPPFVDLHSATWVDTNRFEWVEGARRFETFESFVAGRAGLAVAVDYLRALGIGAVERRVTGLATRLRERLADVPGLCVQDRGERRCGIVTFSVDGQDPLRFASQLRASSINVSVSPMEYARLDLEARGIDALVRASVHYYNSEDEVDRFVTVAAKILSGR